MRPIRCWPADLFHRRPSKEVRAWTVKAGSTAPQAAAVIHTDFEKGFIRAETIGFSTTSSSTTRRSRCARMPGACAWKARNTASRKATCLHFRFNV
uniref:DUF933 domain-containing protein n=1 Tax=Massilia oculi TaxID=945844 RepID=UPI0036D212CF